VRDFLYNIVNVNIVYHGCVLLRIIHGVIYTKSQHVIGCDNIAPATYKFILIFIIF